MTRPASQTWFRRPDSGTCGDDDVTRCLAGLPDLRTELPQVAKHLIDAHLGLARRVGLEGFRLDTVKHVTMAVNRGDAAAALEAPLPVAWRGRPIHDVWRDTPVVVRDGILTGTIPARQAAIFVIRGE